MSHVSLSETYSYIYFFPFFPFNINVIVIGLFRRPAALATVTGLVSSAQRVCLAVYSVSNVRMGSNFRGFLKNNWL